MSDPKPIAGIGLFVGWQDPSNAIEDTPPRPYLIKLEADIVDRAWYAAHQGLVPWNGQDLYVDYYVDPATRMMFAQPSLRGAQDRARAWHAQVSESWNFAEARAHSRWLALYSRYVGERMPRKKLVPRLKEFWLEYVDGMRPDVAPVPLGLPRNPEEVFSDGAWLGWEDWSWVARG